VLVPILGRISCPVYILEFLEELTFYQKDETSGKKNTVLKKMIMRREDNNKSRC
jgi:hypothetical protein